MSSPSPSLPSLFPSPLSPSCDISKLAGLVLASVGRPKVNLVTAAATAGRRVVRR